MKEVIVNKYFFVKKKKKIIEILNIFYTDTGIANLINKNCKKGEFLGEIFFGKKSIKHWLIKPRINQT